MIWGFVGPEGSGKTCTMSYMALMHIAGGGLIQTFPGFKLMTPGGKPLSEEVSFRNLFTDLHAYKNTIICADEIQNFMDSKLSGSVFARLMGYVGAQRRKSNLGIMYTVQDWSWLYNRFRQLTHLLTVCKDAHWTPWGKENHIEKGQMILLTTYDIKGFYTGEPWTLLSRKTLNAKSVWNYYDSYAAVDIFEGMRKYEIKRETEVFDLRPPKEECPVNEEAVDSSSSFELLQGLASQGVNPMTLSKLSKRLK